MVLIILYTRQQCISFIKQSIKTRIELYFMLLKIVTALTCLILFPIIGWPTTSALAALLFIYNTPFASSPLYTTMQLFSLLHCSTVTVCGISSCAPSRFLSSQFTASVYSLYFFQYNRDLAQLTLYHSLSTALVQLQYSFRQF